MHKHLATDRHCTPAPSEGGGGGLSDSVAGTGPRASRSPAREMPPAREETGLPLPPFRKSRAEAPRSLGDEADPSASVALVTPPTTGTGGQDGGAGPAGSRGRRSGGEQEAGGGAGGARGPGVCTRAPLLRVPEPQRRRWFTRTTSQLSATARGARGAEATAGPCPAGPLPRRGARPPSLARPSDPVAALPSAAAPGPASSSPTAPALAPLAGIRTLRNHRDDAPSARRTRPPASAGVTSAGVCGRAAQARAAARKRILRGEAQHRGGGGAGGGVSTCSSRPVGTVGGRRPRGEERRLRGPT